MKRTRGLWISIVFVLLVVAGMAAAFAAGTRPVLGLDLEGGVSIVLTAPDGTPGDVIDRARDNILRRIDALGVAEPQLLVTGTNIEVQIPGLARGTIEERDESSFCLVGEDDRNLGCSKTREEAQTSLDAMEVSRRVIKVCIVGEDGTEIQCFPDKQAAKDALGSVTVERQEGEFCLAGEVGESPPCFKERKEADAALKALATTTEMQFCLGGAGGGCFPRKEEADATLAAIGLRRVERQFCVLGSSGTNLGCFLTKNQAEAALQETGQERLLELIGTTARLEQREVLEEIAQGTPRFEGTPVTCGTEAERLTDECSFESLADQDVVFLSEDGQTKYSLGKVEITGDVIKRATATIDPQRAVGGWQVDFELTSEGAKTFGDVTSRIVGRQLAIVVDRRVVSAPVVQSAITGGAGQITGDFSEREAKDLATVLNAGALPVELNRSEVRTVSATLGAESLHQGLVAGIAGLVGLLLYLAFYYRLLGIVTWFGMTIWAVLALGLVSIFGRLIGYSLTLAGVAGIVVAMGITADSYIVFYERLKDEVRHGKTLRVGVGPAFKRAWRTILAADTVTIMAAAVLYMLAVGSVRGFALTLGAATGLDMFVVYFFKRPTVFLIARNQRLSEMRGFGLRSGVAADPEPTAGAAG